MCPSKSKLESSRTSRWLPSPRRSRPTAWSKWEKSSPTAIVAEVKTTLCISGSHLLARSAPTSSFSATSRSDAMRRLERESWAEYT